MKYRKKLAKLAARIKAREDYLKTHSSDAPGLKKPGSQKK